MFVDRFARLSTVFLLILTSCSLLGGEQATPTPAPEAAPAVTGPATTVSEIVNNVEAHDPGAADWQAAANGQRVGDGGGVRTLADSRARLDFPDGSLARIGPDTVLELSNYADPGWTGTLDQGRVWLNVIAGDLGATTIETPIGVASVRGSWLGVFFDQIIQYMLATCLEGVCTLFNAFGQVTFNAGEQAAIPGPNQGPGPVMPMDPSEIILWAGIPEVEDLVRALLEQQERAPAPTPTPTTEPDSGDGDESGSGGAGSGAGGDQGGAGPTTGQQPAGIPEVVNTALQFGFSFVSALSRQPASSSGACGNPGEWTACGGSAAVSCPADSVGYCKEDGTWTCLWDPSYCSPQQESQPDPDHNQPQIEPGNEQPQEPTTSARRSDGPRTASNLLVAALVVAFGLTYSLSRHSLDED